MNLYLRKPYQEVTMGSLMVRYIAVGFIMLVVGFLLGSGQCVSEANADQSELFWQRHMERMVKAEESQKKSLEKIAKELYEIRKAVKR